MPEPPSKTARPATISRRILIVDDADEARAILSIALGTIPGASVAAAESAEEALAMLAVATVDILVTDIRMPGMSGLELLAALRERELWPLSGVLVISGETDPGLKQRTLDMGVNVFFTKPFSAGEVRRTVISLLESSYGMV